MVASSPRPRTASDTERAQAGRAHLAAWLSILPLLGTFTAFGIQGRAQRRSPWVAQQALQSSIFQIFTFNLLLLLLTIVTPLAWLGWDGRYNGDALVLAIVLTALPFAGLHYLAQGLLASGAARAVWRGEDFRYPLIGRLVGRPAPTSADLAAAEA